MKGRWGWWALALGQLWAALWLAVWLRASGSLPWWCQVLLIAALAAGAVRLLGGLLVTRGRARAGERP